MNALVLRRGAEEERVRYIGSRTRSAASLPRKGGEWVRFRGRWTAFARLFGGESFWGVSREDREETEN